MISSTLTILMLCSLENLTRSSLLAIVPSSFIISHITPAGYKSDNMHAKPVDIFGEKQGPWSTPGGVLYVRLSCDAKKQTRQNTAESTKDKTKSRRDRRLQSRLEQHLRIRLPRKPAKIVDTRLCGRSLE